MVPRDAPTPTATDAPAANAAAVDTVAPRGAPTRRTALVGVLSTLAATLSLPGCGGSDSPAPPPDVPPPPPPAPPVVPVDGPAWPTFARDAQHAALGAIATQALTTIWWSTPVDLAPPYTGSGSLLAHYGSPVITRHNTVVVPVKVDAAGNFRVDAFVGINGQALWTLATDYRLPPHQWVPSLNVTLTPDGRVLVPAAGGRVLERADADAATGAQRHLVFYGEAEYAAAPAVYDATVVVNTPITCDSQGNAFFGFTVTGLNPLGLVGGIARLGADGSGRWVGAAAASGDTTMVKAATNSAPALSLDEGTLYVVVNGSSASGQRPAGRLLALDATTLATLAGVPLVDPALQSAAWVSDNATSSPTVGPDGDVYIGVLEAAAPSHSFRGWLLHFDAALGATRTPGGFGWDSTASVVPRAMVPQYAGTSPYLLALKYNSYAGIGAGDGQHRVAIVDPHAAQADRFSSVPVMREVLTVLGPTADPYVPGGRKEWCINTAAVDPLTSSVLMNSEDGALYRWHLPSDRLSERLRLNNGYAQSYTPTAIGADGRVYTVNNARLFSVGA